MNLSKIANIVAIALTLLSVILFGSMGGERTNLFNPILALLIIGFVLMALTGGVRIFVSGSDHSYPIVLIVANAVSLLCLLVSWFIFIAAMANDGPVKMEQMIPQSPAGVCQATTVTFNKEFCARNSDECRNFMDACLNSQSTTVNHHCNAAMVFVVISCKS